jgi:uncharacterized membrane protein
MKTGRTIAPFRFIAFVIGFAVATAALWPLLPWQQALLGGFDLAATGFVISIVPLLRMDKAEDMRALSRDNDANRVLLLAITGAVTSVVLVAIYLELQAKSGPPDPTVVALVIATLAIAWVFSNTVYALHYAHQFYRADEDGKDCGGIDVPDAAEPDYWDFIYFAFILGMTFQTSDVEITSRSIRRTVTFHCLAAFVFNIGVLAFTINLLGGGAG